MSSAPTAAPLYVRVAVELATLIERGLRPGERLPSERALCASLGVSRVTLRSGLARLEDQGLVVSSAARGWFVSQPDAPRAPGSLMSFTEMATGRGLQVSCRVLQAHARPAEFEEADALQVAPGAVLFELRRLRFLDGLITAVDHSRVPLALAPDLVTVDFRHVSLYETLRNRYRPVVPTRAEYSVAAVPAAPQEAQLLDLDADAPVLVAVQVTYDQNGRRVELGRTVYRGDRFRFQATISAAPALAEPEGS